MHAVVITEPGEPEVLQWLEVPDPVAGAGEVVIDIAASGVNRADLMQRQGLYPPPPGAPPYPGLECSGRIRPSATASPDWRPATRCARCWPAAATPSRSRCRRAGAARAAAGGLTRRRPCPRTACTVWSNVFMLARLRPGETLLVHGGGSGIGTMAIQLGKADRRPGGRAPRARREKLTRCRELGADIPINYRDEDFVESRARRHRRRGRRRRSSTSWAPATWPATSAALATDGRLVIIGLQGGSRAELDLGVLHGQAGQRTRDHAALPARRSRRPRSWRPSASTCGRSSAPGRSGGHRPGAADVAGAAGAPGHGGQRAHRQDLAVTDTRRHERCRMKRAGQAAARIGQTRGMSDGMNPQAQDRPQVLVVGPDGIATPAATGSARRRTPAASARSPRWSSSRPRSCGSAT